jgi:hypothetical protein
MRLMMSRAGTEEFEPALKEADQLARSDSGLMVYGCACAYALAHARTKDDKYAARAVELLRQAVAKGYRDVADMKKRPDFDSLRARDDFRQLLAELETKSKESGPKR